jgi:hypothetical protein
MRTEAAYMTFRYWHRRPSTSAPKPRELMDSPAAGRAGMSSAPQRPCALSAVSQPPGGWSVMRVGSVCSRHTTHIRDFAGKLIEKALNRQRGAKVPSSVA